MAILWGPWAHAHPGAPLLWGPPTLGEGATASK
jgi:hypothetical protein